MWLNPTPYVFFTMVSFYLALTEREELSIAAIAVATLYKQLAVVFFPILSIVLLKKRLGGKNLDNVRGFIKHTIIYAGIVFLVSVPFLIVSPEQYLNQMLFWNTGNYDTLRTFIPDLWMTVHLNTFFLWLGGPSWFTDMIALLLVNYVFLIICALVVYGTFAIFKPQDAQGRVKELVTQALLWGFVAVMCVQLFYPRGAYKFYLLALAPFVSILYDYQNLEMKQEDSGFKRHHIVPIVLSWIVFVCYRFVYFWILGAWLIFYLWKSGGLSRIAGGLRLLVRPPDKESTAISVYEEIYGDDLGEFDAPLPNESTE
jgi:predicted membrane-bound dolichyl-phosphate-mannose-protein mannosyltransferase